MKYEAKSISMNCTGERAAVLQINGYGFAMRFCFYCYGAGLRFLVYMSFLTSSRKTSAASVWSVHLNVLISNEVNYKFFHGLYRFFHP
jgi:hypothetical protein